MISRRAFLSLTGGAAAAAGAVAIGGPPVWRSLVEDHVHDAARHRDTSTTLGGDGVHKGRVLVVVSMGGGNDGLNTLVPAGNGIYYDSRPTLAVPENQLVALAGATGYGLNPVLAPLKSWWDDGRLVAVDGVAFPDQTRSHFMASDVWWTASPSQPHGYGWLGRWLDATGDPSNPLRAMSLGMGSTVLLGHRAMATTVSDPATFSLMTPKGVDATGLTKAFLATAHPLSSDPTMAAAQQAIPDTMRAVSTLTPVLNGAKASVFAPSSTPAISASTTTAPAATNAAVDPRSITGLLESAAGIIGLELGTQIIVVGVTGFDTHAAQAQRHPELLADVARGIDGFLALMDKQGRSDDVLVVTTSEFGRRVHENGSGTDHGTASVHFLAGGKVKGGRVVGTADLGQLDDGDLPLHIDSRSIYATALDWLGGPTDEVLDGTFDRMGLVST